ncbi:MDR/zinc-dependent alcohol dehydrogenase-like family protein [Pseudomonas sp. KNUC1026]|uniref:MDR/zinc-dependent alcohol dehydrogenase-like family protein n=1 Tax=Pseudomonas sp. KNUC1026 TaxID=2893890 RepID=UPI001F222E04|nr:medium chain dehydrogenase/reductase family protein [Pseudomonas sp. KNUC1026]UFH51199.1 zinc-binding dehydrogenase [Pseudomonas sp. KNUC1026]
MQAAVLKSLSHPLVVESVAAPVRGSGEVLVDVVAAPVLAYANEVFNGARRYSIELPLIPGCGAIGRVLETGPDATRLRVGEWVFCDPTVRSRDDARMPDIVLQGWSARGDGGLQLHRYYHDGPFAQVIRVPTENAAPIGEITAEEAPQWCALNTLLIPYGGWLAAGLAPGETALVSGATGHFGSAATLVALAMGAARVVAPGRNAAVLADLVQRFGDRVVPVMLSGDEQQDRQAMQAAAQGPIDCVMDILPPSVSARTVRTAAMTVRPYGRVVLMGGVGMLGADDLALPYPWLMRNNITLMGQWMYPRTAVSTLVGLIRAKLLPLNHFDVTAHPLAAVNEAVAQAARDAGAFRMTVLRP